MAHVSVEQSWHHDLGPGPWEEGSMLGSQCELEDPCWGPGRGTDERLMRERITVCAGGRGGSGLGPGEENRESSMAAAHARQHPSVTEDHRGRSKDDDVSVVLLCDCDRVPVVCECHLVAQQINESVAVALQVQREVCGVHLQLPGQHAVENLKQIDEIHVGGQMILIRACIAASTTDI